jgi:signal transduction histidine kinase
MVMDDGRGFDLREAISQGGLGLTSLNERARMLHGTFQITSASGQGTKLVVELPTEEGEGI